MRMLHDLSAKLLLVFLTLLPPWFVAEVEDLLDVASGRKAINIL
jgi:hypothetical protein